MKDRFANFYSYHTYEDVPLRDLIKKRFNIKESFVKSEIRLSDKKERLIKSQEFDKWELNSEGMSQISKLKAKPELAKKFILPKETNIVENKRLLLNYYSNQVKAQVTDM